MESSDMEFSKNNAAKVKAKAFRSNRKSMNSNEMMNLDLRTQH